jgi:transposase
MGYSIDLRKKVLEFLSKGHSIREAGRIFGLAPCTVNRWKKKLAKTGELRDAPRKAGFRKLDPEKLKAYVEAHPDSYLAEIGEEFGCNESAVRKAFRKLGSTRKKKPSGSGSRSRSR